MDEYHERQFVSTIRVFDGSESTSLFFMSREDSSVGARGRIPPGSFFLHQDRRDVVVTYD